MEKDKLGPLSSIIGTISFMVFGVMACINLKIPLNKTNIVFGIIIGLFLGFFSKKIFIIILSLLNSDVKKEHGKDIVSKTVKKSTIFMFPFATMVFLATIFLGWTTAGVFYSAGVMNTAVMASMEIGKLKGKVGIKNTIATSIAASLLSYGWLFSVGYIKNIPPILESGVRLLLPLMGVKI
jgi:hypothetical protein